LDFSGVFFNQNGDEHLEAEDMTLKNAFPTNNLTDFEFLITNLSNQLIVEDIYDLISES
jgi:hypothetical protein